MEADDELKGEKNSYTTEYRKYDPRIGKWLSIDPLAVSFASWSPYNMLMDNPIIYNDPDGLAPRTVIENEETGETTEIDDGLDYHMCLSAEQYCAVTAAAAEHGDERAFTYPWTDVSWETTEEHLGVRSIREWEQGMRNAPAKILDTYGPLVEFGAGVAAGGLLFRGLAISPPVRAAPSAFGEGTVLRERARIGSSPRVFSSSGSGEELIRSTTLRNGQIVQVKSGHGYNRAHRSGDLRDTNLTMDQIDNGILDHLQGSLQNGINLPLVGAPGFNGPGNFSTTINGVTVGYRAVKLQDGRLSIGTYWPD